MNGRTDTFAHFGWVGVLHTATMTGLAPGGHYYYRVGDASGAFGERWSQVWSFKALPADAGTDASPLRMASVGDMGYANNSDGTVAQLSAESVDVLYVGRHVADFQALPASVLVNQFVGESCVTSKLLIQVQPPPVQPVPIIAKLS